MPALVRRAAAAAFPKRIGGRCRSARRVVAVAVQTGWSDQSILIVMLARSFIRMILKKKSTMPLARAMGGAAGVNKIEPPCRAFRAGGAIDKSAVAVANGFQPVVQKRRAERLHRRG